MLIISYEQINVFYVFILTFIKEYGISRHKVLLVFDILIMTITQFAIKPQRNNFAITSEYLVN